jgi:hypothetical protein
MRKQDIERLVAFTALWEEQRNGSQASAPSPSGGEVDATLEAYSVALDIAFERKDWQSYSETSLAVCDHYLQTRQIERAIRHAEGALAILAAAALSPDTKVRVESPQLLLKLGIALAVYDEPEKAKAALAVAREAFEARCDYHQLGQVFDALARLAKRAGDVVSMRQYAACAMEHKQTARDFVGIAATMMILDEKDRFQPGGES